MKNFVRGTAYINVLCLHSNFTFLARIVHKKWSFPDLHVLWYSYRDCSTSRWACTISWAHSNVVSRVITYQRDSWNSLTLMIATLTPTALLCLTFDTCHCTVPHMYMHVTCMHVHVHCMCICRVSRIRGGYGGCWSTSTFVSWLDVTS